MGSETTAELGIANIPPGPPPPVVMAVQVQSNQGTFLAYQDREGKWRHYWTGEVLPAPVVVGK